MKSKNKLQIGRDITLEDVMLETIEISKRVAYISGSISLDPNFYEKFDAAERKWSKMFDIVNPCKIKDNLKIENKPENWKRFMVNDIREMISKCDTVIVLKDWYLSRGSIIELFIAQHLGLNLIDNETGKQFMFKFKVQVEYIK